MQAAEGGGRRRKGVLAVSGYAGERHAKTLDRFLRDIWLECCGHESAFFVGNYEQLSKNTMVGMLHDGLKLHYEYDFGSTTELTITVVGTLLRPKQRRSVRLLGRNEPIRFLCGKCGKEADWICCECEW